MQPLKCGLIADHYARATAFVGILVVAFQKAWICRHIMVAATGCVSSIVSGCYCSLHFTKLLLMTPGMQRIRPRRGQILIASGVRRTFWRLLTKMITLD
jgi:hypothetical protein